MSDPTTVASPIPEPQLPASPLPIVQAIKQLLQSPTLNPFKRAFLLQVLTRQQPLIWPDALAAIAHIQILQSGDYPNADGTQ